jgi:hypothetical protein
MSVVLYYDPAPVTVNLAFDGQLRSAGMFYRVPYGLAEDGTQLNRNCGAWGPMLLNSYRDVWSSSGGLCRNLVGLLDDGGNVVVAQIRYCGPNFFNERGDGSATALEMTDNLRLVCN